MAPGVTAKPSAQLKELAGGDRRSIGKANLVVAKVLAAPELLPGIVAGLEDADPVVRLRAADVAEKVSAKRPRLLAPHKATLMRLIRTAQEKELRWHLAQMAPRLPLDENERADCVETLFAWLGDESPIVVAAALQALADLADRSPEARRRLAPALQVALQAEAPAVRARARTLLERLKDQPP